MEDQFIFIIILKVICGAIAAAIASSKGRSTIGWFFGGFFLDIIGIIIVAVIANLKEQQAHRQHVSRENRRLREQLHQERMKQEAFRQHATARLDVHDDHMGLDTKQVGSALPGATAQQYLLDGGQETGGHAKEGLDGLAAAAAGINPNPGSGGTSSPPPPPNAATPPPVPPVTSPAVSVREWHYELSGEPKGPIPEPQLIAKIRFGEISTETLVWTEELTDWKAAGQINGLRKYFEA